MSVIGNIPNRGFALIDGLWLRHLANGGNRSFSNALIATAGGNKATGFQIPGGVAMINFATVATAGDSAVLPAAKSGNSIMLASAGVANMNLYAKGTDSINNAAAATAYVVPPNIPIILWCPIDGVWYANKSA